MDSGYPSLTDARLVVPGGGAGEDFRGAQPRFVVIQDSALVGLQLLNELDRSANYRGGPGLQISSSAAA
jgi:hypothetical protein